jgi:cobalt-zinc-cadmium efflux system membrane fusion protein
MTVLRSRSFSVLFALATGATAVCALVATGCHKTQAAEAAGPQPAAGEVWLTKEQVTEAKIQTEAVGEQDVDDVITTSGRVTFDDLKVSHIFSPVTGRVVKIDAQLGEHVKKGQTLAVIQSPDVGSATSDIGKADADLIAAQHDFDRKKDLYASHAASQADYETAEDTLRRAQAEKARAVQRGALFHSAGGNDSVSSGFGLTSTIDGEVIARNVNPGAEIQGQYGQGGAVELFTVGELDSVWVLADIYEMDIARLKPGAHATVKVVSYPNKVFDGRVDWVSGMLDPVSRTAKIRCVFDNKDRLLKPEMYAQVDVAVDQKRELAIPRTSIVRMGDQTVVFAETGAAPDGRVKYERLPVTVDEGEASQWLPVAHGIDAGTKIVTSGSILLSGML